MNKFLLTTALVALTALSACKKDEPADVAPAAGDETSMSAPADTTTTTTTTEAAPATDAATPAEPTVAPTTDATTTTTTTTTTQGVAVGEPNPTSCGDHADLIGKAIADVDQAALGSSVRVIKPGDAVTEDYSAERIDIEVDADGKVTGVHCG